MDPRSTILAVQREPIGVAVLEAWGLATDNGPDSPEEAHLFVGQRLLARRVAGWVWERHEVVARRYELQHGLFHLEAAGKSDQAREISIDPAFLDQLTGESLRCTRDGDIERATGLLSRALAGYGDSSIPIEAVRACRYLAVLAYERGARQLGTDWFQKAVDQAERLTERNVPLLQRNIWAQWARAEAQWGNLDLAEKLWAQACSGDRHLVELTETRARLRRWDEVLKTLWPADMDVLGVCQLLMLRCEALFACGQTPLEDGQRLLKLLNVNTRPTSNELTIDNLNKAIWLLRHAQDFPGRGLDGGAVTRRLYDLVRHLATRITCDPRLYGPLEDATTCVSTSRRSAARDACLWAIQLRRAQWLQRLGYSELATGLCLQLLRDVPDPPDRPARRLMAALLFSLRDTAPALREPLVQILNGFLPVKLRRPSVSEALLRQARTFLDLPNVLDVTTLIVHVSCALLPRVDPNRGAPLVHRVVGLRREILQRFGFHVLGVRFRDDLGLANGDYTVSLYGRVVAQGNVGRLPSDEEGDSSIIDTLREVMLQHLPELMDQAESIRLTNSLHRTHPGHRTFAFSCLGIERLTALLQALLRRGVPVGNLPRILELAGQTGASTSSVQSMEESIRAGLCGQETEGWHVELVRDGANPLVYERIAGVRVPQVPYDQDPSSSAWLMQLLVRSCRGQNRWVQSLALWKVTELLRQAPAGLSASKERVTAAFLRLSTACVVLAVGDAFGSCRRILARPFAVSRKRRAVAQSKP